MGLFILTEAEIARAGIEVLPVQKAPFTLHREFPATIRANETNWRKSRR